MLEKIAFDKLSTDITPYQAFLQGVQYATNQSLGAVLIELGMQGFDYASNRVYVKDNQQYMLKSNNIAFYTLEPIQSFKKC